MAVAPDYGTGPEDTSMDDTRASPQADLLDAIRGVVGERGLLANPSDNAAYVKDWRRLFRGSNAAAKRSMSAASIVMP
jgi:hypothetical protein